MSGPVERIETAYADYFEERQHAIADAGVIVRDLPGATLFAAKYRAEVDWMNTGLLHERPSRSLMEDVTGFYDGLRLRPRLETLSGEPSGFAPAGELFVLVSMPGSEPPAPPDVKVRSVDRSTFARFADTYVKAFGRDDIRRSDVDSWERLDNWRFHLAEIDGKPAGAAILTLHGELACLASSATLPTLRRRGVHAALIRARMLEAADAGSSLIFARATPGGAGASGLMRARMVLSHRKQVWSLPR